MRFDCEFQLPPDDHAKVPAGQYICRVGEVRQGTTQAGDVYWALRLEVAEGDHAGVTAGWDNLVFSDRARGRARFVLESLGFETRGVLDLEPADLVGRRVLATFVLEEQDDPVGGLRTRLRVPWSGYGPAPADRAAAG